MPCKGCNPRLVLGAYVALALNRSPEMAKRRLDICNVCRFNIEGRCSQCQSVVKCFVVAKVRGKSQVCPEHKW